MNLWRSPSIKMLTLLVSLLASTTSNTGARARIVPASRLNCSQPLTSEGKLLKCADMVDVHENMTVPEVPAGTLISNEPVADPCMSVMEILYRHGLFMSSNVLRLGLRRSSAILFDPFAALTVLAPTDAAFQRVNISSDRMPDNRRLSSIAGAHVVPGVVTSRDLVCAAGPDPVPASDADIDVRTWDNERLTLHMGVSRIATVADSRNRTSRIVRADIPACVAVVHILDEIIQNTSRNDTVSAQPGGS